MSMQLPYIALLRTVERHGAENVEWRTKERDWCRASVAMPPWGAPDLQVRTCPTMVALPGSVIPASDPTGECFLEILVGVGDVRRPDESTTLRFRSAEDRDQVLKAMLARQPVYGGPVQGKLELPAVAKPRKKRVVTAEGKPRKKCEECRRVFQPKTAKGRYCSKHCANMSYQRRKNEDQEGGH